MLNPRKAFIVRSSLTVPMISTKVSERCISYSVSSRLGMELYMIDLLARGARQSAISTCTGGAEE